MEEEESGATPASRPSGATAGQLERWLARRPGTRWCDACLAARLPAGPGVVRRALGALRAGGLVVAEIGRCVGCGATGVTARARGPQDPPPGAAAASAGGAVRVGTLVMTAVAGTAGPTYELVFAAAGEPREPLPAVRCAGPRALLRVLADLLGDAVWRVETLDELRREGTAAVRDVAVREEQLRRHGLWPPGGATSRG